MDAVKSTKKRGENLYPKVCVSQTVSDVIVEVNYPLEYISLYHARTLRRTDNISKKAG